jgi:LmbE family N-acetylglucosaminyl deacetylase
VPPKPKTPGATRSTKHEAPGTKHGQRGAESRPKLVLCLGAHADDIEIGCGGTLMRLLETWPGAEVHWHVFSAPGPRRGEAMRSAKQWLATAGARTVKAWSFRESYFPDQWAAVKDAMEQVRASCEPDLIFTHWREDRHQDHRVISDLTWNAFRDHAILEYEIPKYDGDFGQPNVYVPLDETACRRKVKALMRNFPSQASKHWFTPDTLLALPRLRGIECGPRVQYAEAFHARKLVLGVTDLGLTLPR